MSDRYAESEEFLSIAERRIPLGSQTFSKSRTQYPVGISPLFTDRAKGAYIWDIDNNKYLDLVNSLAAITIGYKDKRVNAAVRTQLKQGVTLSLPSRLESQVAEMISFLVPSAEMMRFGKNGTDATSAAVRLSRAYSGRSRVAMCGYHGWQDWSIGTTSRNLGVPQDTSKLTHTFVYNDIESLSKLFSEFPNQIACVILEPMNSEYPKNNFLQDIRSLCDQHNSILIFDETITGFRLNKGGAQNLFGVTPDLSTFGKGIANGFPLSVVAGRKDIMMEMENIFFSGTFGGELLSLAAAKEVLTLHMTDLVAPKLENTGIELVGHINAIIEDLRLGDVLKLTGHPSWTFLNWHPIDPFSQNAIKTYFLQEMFKEGILILNTHNLSTAFNKKEVQKLKHAYEKVLSRLELNLRKGSLLQNLKVEPLVPLFKVR